MGTDYKYWAFISYSHQDRAWGDWLHKALETYTVPARLVGRESPVGPLPRRLFPVFRDRDELPSSANLGDVLNDALRRSRYQIVICSPRSANSRWVNEEIKYFKSLDRENRVLALIVDGTPNASADECFPPALRYRITAAGEISDVPTEPIAADARAGADGRAGARLKLIAGLLGIGLDELIQRERQRRLWQRTRNTLAAAAFAGLCLGAWQWYQADRGAREHEILVEKLVDNGRRELLAGQHARAAVYLNEAYALGEDSVPLRFMLAQAMKPIEALTDVRIEHGGVAVYKSAFTPDGRRFMLHVMTKGTGEQQAVARMYDSATGALLLELADVPPLPLHLEFLDDASALLITGFPHDERIGQPQSVIWDLHSGKERIRLDGIAGLSGSPLSPDGAHILIATEKGLRVHDTQTGRIVTTFFDGRTVTAGSYSPDGALVAVADAQGVVHLLSTTDGRVRRQLPETRALSIAALRFTPNGRRLFALTGRDENRLLLGDLRVWEVETGLLRLAFSAQPDFLTEILFDQKGQYFLTIGSEGYKVWSTLRGVLLFSLPRALRLYASGALSPDGHLLITADFENKVAEAWDISSKRKLYTLDLHIDGVSNAQFGHDGASLLLASRDGTAELWRMPVLPSLRYESFETLPFTVRFDQSGERLIVGGGDTTQGNVMSVDLSAGPPVTRLARHEAVVRDVALSADQRQLLTASLDGSAMLWDLTSGQRLARMQHNADGTETARFNAANNRILTTTYPHFSRAEDAAGLWDGADGRHIAWLGHSGQIVSARFDRDGNRVVTAGLDRRIKVWSAEDGALLLTLPEFNGHAGSVHFSLDGSHLLSTAHGSQVRISDSHSGVTIHQLDNSDIGIPAEAIWSPDERIVAIATHSGDIWLWEPETDLLTTLKGHDQRSIRLLFSPDGMLLYSDSSDGTVRAWDVSKGRELAVLLAFERRVDAMDLHANSGRIAASAWSQYALADIAIESRFPRQLAETLACRTPWRLDRETLNLTPQSRPPGQCRPATAAPVNGPS